MLTMRCSKCGQDKPLEAFELGAMRPQLHSHELQALDRLRREPEQVCQDCYRPSQGLAALDMALGQGDTADTDPGLDLLADAVDWLRRRFGRRRDP